MTAASLHPFYPIVDECNWLRRLLPLGVRLIQLRIKDRSQSETREQISTAKALCQKYQCQLIVNDYWKLAIELGCDFIHLGQEDLDSADVTAIREAGIRFGISTHSDDELNRALGLAPDYIALGPIYPTLLKKMPWAPQGLKRVTQWKQRIGNTPLIGIGGLSLDRAPGVFESGADVVSVVTDITLNSDPEAQTCRWLALTTKFRQSDG